MKKLVLIVAAYLILDGFVLPPLISAKSDEAVAAGFGILGLSIIGLYKTFHDTFFPPDRTIPLK